MKRETIERNKNKIKEYVLDNREMFENIMKADGCGWEIDIDKDDVLVDNVCEQLADTDENNENSEYFECFDWLFYEAREEEELGTELMLHLKKVFGV